MMNKTYLLTLLISTLCYSCWGRSFDGPGGHAYDFRHVLEGCSGEELEALYKRISHGTDNLYYDVTDKFGKIPGNHRIIGHWGFEGAIPFNEEPWKSQLSGIPKNKLIEMWRNFTISLVKYAEEKTGLPTHQAKGLVGLLYNVHLLGDRVYGNVEVTQILKPDLITNDIVKNLHRLFGNNSELAKSVAKEIASIPKHAVYASKCDQVIKILYRHQIGTHFYNTYRTQLSQHQIRYINTMTGKMLLKTAPYYKINSNILAKEMSAYVSGNTGRIVKPLKGNIKFVQGVLQKVSVKGKNVLVLSIPINSVKLGLKVGAYSGVATFVFSEGVSVYKFAHGDITEDEFLRQSIKNLGTSLAVGAAAFVCVALGASPYGWVVAGICIGTAIIVDLTFEHIYKEFKTPIITMNDVLGKLPTELQRRPNVWDHSGFEYLNEQNQKRLNIFSKINKGSGITIPQRSTIFTPPQRTSVLGE